MTSTEFDTKLETKLTQLKIAVKASAVLDSGKKLTIKRQIETLLKIVRETNQCKNAEEAKKTAEKTQLSELSDWSNEIDCKLDHTDSKVYKFEEWVAKSELKRALVAQEKQFEFELKLHEQKLKLPAKLASVSKPKPEMQECELSTAKNGKLPKFVISKFEGSFMDCPRFWGQFTKAMNKSSIAQIRKFTYLNKLLATQVKCCVEALNFSAEGNNRAKAVLKDKYGKVSEIIKCYVKKS